MPPLLLESLEIHNFRTFRHLHIARLGRVNLIVGKNNIGKTSLLEAIQHHTRQGLDELRSVFIPTNGLNGVQIAKLWDSIALTDREDQVLSALRIITPTVERVNLVGDDEAGISRTPIVKFSSIDEPIPLQSLGESMIRVLGIALGLVNAQDRLLLIDGFEHSLHYSVQTAIWRLVFEIAQRLNVQVFATTHSWDCITGFQHAAQEAADECGILMRLGKKQDNIISTIFDKRELAIVTREQIEVR